MKPAFALILLLGLAPAWAGAADAPDAPPPGYYTFQKVVYQNDSGWPGDGQYFRELLTHIAAHLRAVDGKVEIRVVSFGAGLKMFTMAKSDHDLAAQIDAMRAKGVKFEICRNTMEGMHLTIGQLYGVQADDVVPSGVAEIARLQGLGFVFEHP